MPNPAQKKTSRRPTKLALSRIQKQDGEAVEVQGDRLVIRISREHNPELYDIDRLSRLMKSMMQTYARRQQMRDFVDFLAETDRSLQIILRNHLDVAMRKYIG
ncbi:MAG: hypothetical protein ACREID_05310 [Planctomycetota bacterium]